MRDYELMCVLNPGIEDEGIAGAVERVKRFVDQNGGSMTHEEQWGRRKLAYPVEKFTEGNYILMRLQLEPTHTEELEHTLKMTEGLLLHLLVRLNA